MFIIWNWRWFGARNVGWAEKKHDIGDQIRIQMDAIRATGAGRSQLCVSLFKVSQLSQKTRVERICGCIMRNDQERIGNTGALKEGGIFEVQPTFSLLSILVVGTRERKLSEILPVRANILCRFENTI